jgi:hypothetical protein
MTLLIYAGLLYLLGIGIALVIKPTIMFSSDGAWKEFGLGRNKERYTWFPFWLFAIAWAIISYTIVLVIVGERKETTASNEIHTDIIVEKSAILPTNISTKSIGAKGKASLNMKDGYYILDVNETQKRGIPKYIYLGPEAPNVIYNAGNNEIHNAGHNEIHNAGHNEIHKD